MAKGPKTMSGGRNKLFAGASVFAAAFAAFTATPAVAQDQDDDAIIVTGSRVARSTFTAESPVTVITGATIAEAGELNLGEVLRTQLAVGTNGFNQSSNLSGGGASSIDLRNLGPDRVLNLINGRRVAAFGDNLQNEAADLNFIPLAMVSRIEILRDGASAVYGADAVTGVVNVILRDDFEGFEFSSQYGLSDFGDREQVSLSAVLGVSSERGNVIIGAEYARADIVFQRERDWAIPTIAGLTSTGVVNGSGFHPGGDVQFFDPGTGALTGNRWCTRPQAMGGDERTNVWGTNLCPSSPLAASDPDQLVRPGGRYDYALVQSILNGFENYNLAAFGNYKLNDSVGAFLEFQYSNSDRRTVLDANPIPAGSGSVAFPSGWIVAADNPYNPFPGEAGFVAQRPTSTLGPRDQTIEANSIRLVAGLQGDIADNISWEVAYIFTEVSATSTTDATWNLARAIRISDPTACASDPICTAALQPGSLGALDAYRPANWSQSEIDYFRQVATSNSDFSLEGFSAFLGGSAYELPAGPLSFAIGFDYREENVLFRPDAVTEAGESIANQTYTTIGGFDVSEVYGELNIPLLSGVPLAEDLSINLQARRFDYSNFGDDSVYKVGLNWSVTNDLRLRATYGTSFRAPTLIDVFSGGTVSFQFIDDPCDADVLVDENNANRIANCTAAVGVGFQQSAPQLAVLGGGDLADGTFDLRPEEATTYTVGLIYQPSFLAGLRLSLDYWSIEVTNFIDTVDVETEILDVCYDSLNLSAPECAQGFYRTGTGQLAGLVQTPINRPSPLETAGLDWAADWMFSAFGGAVTLDHQGTYITDYNIAPGVGNYASNSGITPVAEYRLNFGAKYEIGPVGFGIRARYIPYIEDTRAAFDGTNGPADNPVNYDGIDEHLEFDLRFHYDPSNSTRILFGVNNVTGEDPPYAFNTGNNTVPGLYGSAIVGRYFFARLTQRF